MKITFISNFHNHHQMPLCDALVAIPQVDFTFIATQKVPQERIAFGYKHEFDQLPYYREAIEPADAAAAEQLCYDSDVVIIGSAPISFVRRRLRAKKLTFSYNERWFKTGFWRHPGDVYRSLRDFTRFNNRRFYQLCASAYTAPDSRRVGAFPGRKLRWGYFPEIKEYDLSALMEQKQPTTLLWVGRFLDWKHPEKAVEVARRLKEDGFDFRLTMIGNGEMEEPVRELISRYDLEDRVCMPGAMSPEAVRRYMEATQVYLFTSDFTEGWGAVLNEAMNSGCAVVASHAIGSVPYLIDHGDNGFIYQNEDFEQLYGYVRRLLTDGAQAQALGAAAYHTVRQCWNGATAARRLYDFSRAVLTGAPLPRYPYGPMSFDKKR